MSSPAGSRSPISPPVCSADACRQPRPWASSSRLPLPASARVTTPWGSRWCSPARTARSPRPRACTPPAPASMAGRARFAPTPWACGISLFVRGAMPGERGCIARTSRCRPESMSISNSKKVRCFSTPTPRHFPTRPQPKPCSAPPARCATPTSHMPIAWPQLTTRSSSRSSRQIRCASIQLTAAPGRCACNAGELCTARGTSSSRAARAHLPIHCAPEHSTKLPSACRRSRPWASTLSTCRRSIRSVTSIARARTTP